MESRAVGAVLGGVGLRGRRVSDDAMVAVGFQPTVSELPHIVVRRVATL